MESKKDEINLKLYADIIENYPSHIATVNKSGRPNLSVASDIKVIDGKTLIISHNEMVNTQKNIQINKYVVLTTFNENWEGVRMFGVAKYYISGKYFDICNQYFLNEETTPKGVIVIKVNKVQTLA